MKNLLLSLLLCSLSFASFGQVFPDRKIARFYLDLARNHAPEAYVVLSGLDDPKDFVKYARGNRNEFGLLEDFNTVVHESLHEYDFKLGGFDAEAYFISEGVVVHTQRSPTYNSRELLRFVPRHLQKEIQRFDPYIDPSSGELHSHSAGIFGLLEEMNAYYHGTLAAVNTYEYFRTLCPDTDFDCWGEGYLQHPANTMAALHEFRLFIGWYLEYADKKHPNVYAACMKNMPLRAAFTLIDQKYEALSVHFDAIREKQIQRMNAAGTKVDISEDGFLMHHYKGGSSGTGTYIPYTKKLKRWLKEGPGEYLEAFRLRGISEANFRQFLAAAG